MKEREREERREIVSCKVCPLLTAFTETSPSKKERGDKGNVERRILPQGKAMRSSGRDAYTLDAGQQQSAQEPRTTSHANFPFWERAHNSNFLFGSVRSACIFSFFCRLGIFMISIHIHHGTHHKVVCMYRMSDPIFRKSESELKVKSQLTHLFMAINFYTFTPTSSPFTFYSTFQ